MALFNVKDFGATGDGVTDDTAAITAAVEAARAAGGGDVYVPTGTYIVSGHNEPSDGAIMLYDNIHLYGDGMGATNIKVADGWNMKMTGVIRTEYGVATNNVTVDNLTIDGNRANVTSKIDGWFNGYAPGKEGHDSNITLDHVEVKDCSGYGFDPHEQTWNLTISNCVSHGNHLDGFVADYIVGGTYTNNVAYNNDRHGFNLCTSSNDLVVSNNIAYGNGDNGITVQRGSENITWPHDITISNNTVYDNGIDGIQIKLADHITVADNEVFDNGKNGIRLYGTDHNTITGNNVYNNSQSQANAFEEIRIQSYDETSGVSGLYYASTNNVIENNTIGGADSDSNYGVREYADGSDYNTVTGNIISGFSVASVALSGGHSSWDHYSVIDYTGNNALSGTNAADSIDAGAGNDTIDGGAGRDTLTGGTGADVFHFSAATDSNDADGQDRITDFDVSMDKIDVSGLGFTSLTSNIATIDGQLRIAYSSSSNRTYLRSDQSPFEVALIGDYRSTLNAFNFIFASTPANQLLNGTDRADTIIGGNGNDTIVGGLGRDIMTGGYGMDVFKFAAVAESVETATDGIADFASNEDKVDLSGLGFSGLTSNKLTAAGELRLVYSVATDRTYLRSDQSEFEFYFKGDLRGVVKSSDFIFNTPTPNPVVGVIVNGSSSNETLNGNAGDDTINGNGGNDVLNGNAGADKIFGGAGNDTINAGDGDDTITGDDGNDVLNGGAGNDRIITNSGVDTLTGGDGADLFVFDHVGGVISDFTNGVDRISLSSFHVPMSQVAVSVVGADSVVDVYDAAHALLAHIVVTGFTGVLDAQDILI
jgi:parallel beta-helix repeat protein